MDYFYQCISCKNQYKSDKIRYRCDCGEILEVKRSDFTKLKRTVSQGLFDKRLGSKDFPFTSGVWRYKELVLPIADKFIVSKPEGNTNLYFVGKTTYGGQRKIGDYVGIGDFYLKHEGENPTGSFKDRGMTVGISQAKVLGAKAVACASTGNTSSSLASYAAVAGIKCFVFLPSGKISAAKLTQSIAYGAVNIQIDGDFDTAMRLVQKICKEYDIYLLNSINPFRVEGQKTIVFEILQQLAWKVPDWIVLPGGNLGNTSAIGKGLLELKELEMIKKLPRMAIIQAKGANPFYQSFISGFKRRFIIKADTIASAIRIGNPVSFAKAKKIIEETNGVVEEVSDQEILDAKAIIDAAGLGCEPASAATAAGAKKLINKGMIKKDSFVVGILTGHILKDPEIIKSRYANKIVKTTAEKVNKEIQTFLRS